ncbi:hypothetical protein ACFXG4_05735 [Nocardia sp. NPDC059246]|uniref:hypothetical protein n=1 Tax=unclassified Nocardia TaxID=2637762 RepID=UPI0036A29D41
MTVAVSPNLVEFAERHGVSAAPFGIDSDELLRAQRDDRRFRHVNPVQRVRAALDLRRRGFAEAARDLLALAGDNEVLVSGMACEEVAAEAARQHGIPLAAMHFFPIRPNRSVAVLAMPGGGHLPGPVNRLRWKALTTARAWALASEIAALRDGAGTVAISPGSGEVPSYTAIQAYDPANTPALQHLQPVQMMLPRIVLAQLSRTAKAPECLCTNLGETGQGVATIAGVRARSVLMRPVVCTGETELFRRLEVGLNLSWSSDGETVTLAITGADPDRFPTRAALRDQVIDEFEAWGLTPSFWS